MVSYNCLQVKMKNLGIAFKKIVNILRHFLIEL